MDDGACVAGERPELVERIGQQGSDGPRVVDERANVFQRRAQIHERAVRLAQGRREPLERALEEALSRARAPTAPKAFSHERVEVLGARADVPRRPARTAR
jgi:hypothetical protein